MKPNFISIIIPTYREAKNISILCERLDKVISNNNIEYEIIIVDDDSQDGISDVVKELDGKFNVTLKIRKNERGLSSAAIVGFELARGDIIAVMDADLSHPPEKIPELIEAIRDNRADFCLGSRFIKGGSADHFSCFRKLNAMIAKILARPFTKVSDPMAGFFAFPRKILKGETKLSPIGFKIGLEIIVKAAPEIIIEIPIFFEERLHGESKLSLKEQLNYLIHLKRLAQYKYPLRTQFIIFSLIGSSGMMVDLSTVFFMKEFVSLPFRISRVAGFILAVTTNFLLNKKFTFPELSKGTKYKQYIKFIIISLFGFSINWLISVYLVENVSYFMSGYMFLLASFIGILGGLVINFSGSKFYIFK